jgi:hypothetical protein
MALAVMKQVIHKQKKSFIMARRNPRKRRRRPRPPRSSPLADAIGAGEAPALSFMSSSSSKGMPLTPPDVAAAPLAFSVPISSGGGGGGATLTYSQQRKGCTSAELGRDRAVVRLFFESGAKKTAPGPDPLLARCNLIMHPPYLNPPAAPPPGGERPVPSAPGPARKGRSSVGRVAPSHSSHPPPAPWPHPSSRPPLWPAPSPPAAAPALLAPARLDGPTPGGGRVCQRAGGRSAHV